MGEQRQDVNIRYNSAQRIEEENINNTEASCLSCDSPGWMWRRGVAAPAACLWIEGAEPRAAVEGDDGGDGRPDEGVAGDGCGDSMGGGAEAAAPRRGT